MDKILIALSYLAVAGIVWYLTRAHYTVINELLSETNAALKDQLFNIMEAKQIYDQLRGLIKPVIRKSRTTHKRKR